MPIVFFFFVLFVVRDFKNAYLHYLAYAGHQDSVESRFNLENLHKFEFDYDISRKQQDISLLEEQRIHEKYRRNSLLVLMIIVLGAAFTIFMSQRRRIREEKSKLEQQRINNELKEQLLDADLKSARRELDSFTKNAVEKNDLIDALKHELDDLKQKPTGPTMEPVVTERIENIQKLIESTILTEEDWTKFKRSFELVHKGFFTRLKETHPELTLGDIRLLALSKLNLSTREMGNMLGISPDSVKKSRQRLRKKLLLTEEESLEGLLKTL